MLTRRKLLMGAALAPAFSMIAKPVLSEITLGSARVTTLSDGNLTLPKSMFFDALPQDELAVVPNRSLHRHCDELSPHGIVAAKTKKTIARFVQ